MQPRLFDSSSCPLSLAAQKYILVPEYFLLRSGSVREAEGAEGKEGKLKGLGKSLTQGLVCKGQLSADGWVLGYDAIPSRLLVTTSPSWCAYPTCSAAENLDIPIIRITAPKPEVFV